MGSAAMGSDPAMGSAAMGSGSAMGSDPAMGIDPGMRSPAVGSGSAMGSPSMGSPSMGSDPGMGSPSMEIGPAPPLLLPARCSQPGNFVLSALPLWRACPPRWVPPLLRCLPSAVRRAGGVTASPRTCPGRRRGLLSCSQRLTLLPGAGDGFIRARNKGGGGGGGNL